MANLLTLRNIITIFVLLFCIACNKNTDNSNILVHSISSEDDNDDVVGSINDPETGKQVIVFVSK